MQKCYCVLVMAAVFVLAAHSTSASVLTFTDDFTGGASLHWANPTTADYSSNTAFFGGSSDNDRKYLHTTDNYGAADFIATIQLTNADGGGGGVFFGIGQGTPNTSAYCEPTNGNFAFMRYNGYVSSWSLATINNNGTESGLGDPGTAFAAGATVTAKLAWVAATSTATFSIDADNNGTYDYNTSVVNTSLTTARLFVGGRGGVYADNFSVVSSSIPEPCTSAMVVTGIIGILAYAWRRRK